MSHEDLEQAQAAERAQLEQQLCHQLRHLYQQADGQMVFPKTVEGDLLRMAHDVLLRKQQQEDASRFVCLKNSKKREELLTELVPLLHAYGSLFLLLRLKRKLLDIKQAVDDF